MDAQGEQPVEREQGGSNKEVKEALDELVSQLARTEHPNGGLANAVPEPGQIWTGTEVFKQILGQCCRMDTAGRALAWAVFNCPDSDTGGHALKSLQLIVRGRLKAVNAMHRAHGLRSRALFPMPLGRLQYVKEQAQRCGLAEFCDPHFVSVTDIDVWETLSLGALNGLAGFDRAGHSGKSTQKQMEALENFGRAAQYVLQQDFELERSGKEAEKELSERFLTYSGEEVPKMQVLSKRQVEAALPPISHGGSIIATDLVCEGTKWFLLHPEESLLSEPVGGEKLQARVHIREDDRLDLCKLLVERNICDWVPSGDVLEVQSTKVLNGMFGVGKGSFLPDGGGEVLRLIMNLRPSNSVFRQLQGATGDLPSITQYLSLLVGSNEEVALFQSDMSSAFYLFKIPSVWSRFLAFNICFKGFEIGRHSSDLFYLGCSVIPMGWSSAVSIMQEIATRLTTLGRLPRSHQVRRKAPVPPWLMETLDTAISSEQSWFHVYLDNFCCMERGNTGSFEQGKELHDALETSWERHGVLSSTKKKVVAASE